MYCIVLYCGVVAYFSVSSTVERIADGEVENRGDEKGLVPDSRSK